MRKQIITDQISTYGGEIRYVINKWINAKIDFFFGKVCADKTVNFVFTDREEGTLIKVYFDESAQRLVRCTTELVEF